jgi:4'-phosphopantetheinyl transferase
MIYSPCLVMSFYFSSSAWLPAPEFLSLDPGWVHIFRLNLDYSQPLSSTDWKILTAQEQERASRFRNERHQQRFSYAHVQVHQILAAYLQVSPEEIEFSLGTYGKPKLVNDDHLRFNLAHSAGMGLLAVGLGNEIGIDIEKPPGNLDHESIARQFFSPAEAAAITALPLDQQPPAFLACWTRKEAYMKARGGGFSIPLESFEVSVLPGEPITLFAPVDNREPNKEWNIFDINPGSGFTAALAVEGYLAGMKCWDWRI